MNRQRTTVKTPGEIFVTNFEKTQAHFATSTKRPPIPAQEAPPIMWKADSSYGEFPEGARRTVHGAERVSQELHMEDQRLRYVQRALSTVLVLVGATTPDLVMGAPIPSATTRAWGTWIATLSRLVFVSPLENADTGAKELSLPAAAVRMIVDWHDEVRVYANAEEEAMTFDEIHGISSQVVGALSLPEIGFFSSEMAYSALSRDPVNEEAAYFAMVIYMSGRALTAYTDAAVRERRPANLEAKFNEGAHWESVSGSLRMTKGCYMNIAKTWNVNVTLRQNVLLPLIRLEVGASYIVGNIVFTIFKMLRGAGMAHASIICEFLRNYPEAGDMPSIAGQVRLAATHSAILMKVSDDIRPYYKLLQGDATSLFDSKQFLRLTSLATEINGRENATQLQYAHAADHALISEFDTYMSMVRDMTGRPHATIREVEEEESYDSQ